MQTKKRQPSRSEVWDLQEQVALSLDYPDTDLVVDTRLARAFDALTDREKTALGATLRGYAQQEIADRLGITQQAVSRTLTRARGRIARQLGVTG